MRQKLRAQKNSDPPAELKTQSDPWKTQTLRVYLKVTSIYFTYFSLFQGIKKYS